MNVGDLYKVRQGYTVCVGCNSFNAGRVVQVDDVNKIFLQNQLHKLEKHETVKQAIYDNKMMKKRGRPRKVEK